MNLWKHTEMTMGYTLTAQAFELAARKFAEAVNGGDWMTDYTEGQRDLWRERLKRGLCG
jgi:hypothetical protein